MTVTAPALALAGLLALGGPSYGGAAADTLQGPGAAVPYVAQGPLLCGGASAAMVERYWGALGVYADDYAHLVTRPAGIRTGALAGALSERGFGVNVLEDDPAAALAWVRDGVPVIALLESGDRTYHYVVVVAAGPDRVRYHDPIRAPGITVDRAAFEERWAPTGHWAMIALPMRQPAGAGPGDEAGDGPPDGDAVADTAAPLPPALQAALAALRGDRPDTAVARVEAYLAGTDAAERRSVAYPLLATARYLAGDELGALAAWNREGEPPVDLVQVRGLASMRYRTVANALGIAPREVLTPAGLQRARRRLGQLPAVRLGRVGYRPLRDGSVEVQAAVLERRRWPVGPLELAATGLGALVNEGAELELGPVLPVGERWRLRGGWQEAQRLAEVEVAVPWPPLGAVATLSGGWTEEQLAVAGDPRPTRSWGRATVRRWMTAWTRLGITAGIERWDGGGRLARAGAGAVVASPGDGLRLGGTVDGWSDGDRVHGRARAGVRLRHETGARAWTLTLGGSLTSAGAPATLWDGAGTGQVRAPLLRGHPLVRDGRLGADAFGRGLVHGTAAHAWELRAGPVRAAAELFVDAARVWAPLAGDGPRSYLDPGLELSLSEGERTVAISVARGDEWVVSARVGGTTLPWLGLR